MKPINYNIYLMFSIITKKHQSRYLVLAIMLLFSCSKTESSADCPPQNRTGAICNDGTRSTATGTGACSTHGGVRSWICR